MSLIILHVDSPSTGFLGSPFSVISGWVQHSEECELPRAHRFTAFIQFGDKKVFARSTFYERPDLDSRYGTGFTVYVDLHCLSLENVLCEEVFLLIEADGECCRSGTFAVDNDVLKQVEHSSENKRAKDSLICSLVDSAAELVKMDNGFLSWRFMQGDFADFAFDVSFKGDPVSSFPYGSGVIDFVHEFSHDQVLLDIGCGLRQSHLPNVINCEIYDYPSTDIVCDGASLPFADGSVDGILSLAVLEHVNNPFVYSAEIMRVLKPGGKLLLKVPFLQAEHGYPYHFFNPTRQGAIELFKGLKVVDQYLGDADHPINTLNQILSIYCSGLPSDAQESFLDLQIRDVFKIADPSIAYDCRSKFMDFQDSETPWLIAWGTSTLFVKPAF